MKDCRNNRGEAAIVEAVLILPTVFLVLSTLLIACLWFADRAVISERCEAYACYAAAEYTNPGSYSVLTDAAGTGGLTDLSTAYLEYERDEVPDEESAVWSQLCADLKKSVLESSLFGSTEAECTVELDSGIFSDRIYVTVTVKYGDGGFLPSGMLTNTVKTERRICDYDSAVTNGELITDVTKEILARSGEIQNTADTFYGKIFSRK